MFRERAKAFTRIYKGNVWKLKSLKEVDEKAKQLKEGNHSQDKYNAIQCEIIEIKQSLEKGVQ